MSPTQPRANCGDFAMIKPLEFETFRFSPTIDSNSLEFVGIGRAPSVLFNPVIFDGIRIQDGLIRCAPSFPPTTSNA
jgi:hypothetical protein